MHHRRVEAGRFEPHPGQLSVRRVKGAENCDEFHGAKLACVKPQAKHHYFTRRFRISPKSSARKREALTDLCLADPTARKGTKLATLNAGTERAAKSLRVEPMPLRGKLSRDASDNVFVASAVAAHAAFVVKQDCDLLALQKPFGVQVVTPVQLIQALQLAQPIASLPNTRGVGGFVRTCPHQPWQVRHDHS